MRTQFALTIVRPLISREVPGWDRLYKRFVGDYAYNDIWADAGPRLLTDKRYGLHRLLMLEEWADRLFFFLGRWGDLEIQLALDRLVGAGDHVVDIGANYGHFALAAAVKVGSKGQVSAFEPNPIAYARLCLHVRMNRLSQVRTEQIGLSDTAGVMSLSVPRVNSGEATFAKSRYADAEHLDCTVGTLDSQRFERPVKFLKLDVEGFEERVLRGGVGLLERDRPIVLTEIVRSHLEAANSSPDAVSRLLTGLGYSPRRIALSGLGSAQSLRTFEDDPAKTNGDYLWLPQEHEAALIHRLEH